MNKPRILVIGERFTDRYFIGTATRLSPESPIPVVAIKEVIQFAGGAGNVAANLRALEADVRELYPPTPYPVKNRLIANNIQVARWDQDDDTVKAFTDLQLKLAKHLFVGLDGVIISDYNKGAFSPEAVAVLGQLIPDTASIYIDTKAGPAKYKLLGKRVIFFPNLKEYTTHDYSGLNVVRKESELGMTYYDRPSNFSCHSPAYATKVVSVSGAGDTAIAAFAYKDCVKDTPLAILDFASRACAIVVSKPYTSTVTHAEINAFTP